MPPDLERIGKGKSGMLYEFGVKTSYVVSHQIANKENRRKRAETPNY